MTAWIGDRTRCEIPKAAESLSHEGRHTVSAVIAPFSQSEIRDEIMMPRK